MLNGYAASAVRGISRNVSNVGRSVPFLPTMHGPYTLDTLQSSKLAAYAYIIYRLDLIINQNWMDGNPTSDSVRRLAALDVVEKKDQEVHNPFHEDLWGAIASYISISMIFKIEYAYKIRLDWRIDTIIKDQVLARLKHMGM